MTDTRKINGISVQSGWTADKQNRYITLQCECSTNDMWKCKYALGEIRPMREGDVCCFRDDNFECRMLECQVDALKLSIDMLKEKRKEIEEEIKEAE